MDHFFRMDKNVLDKLFCLGFPLVFLLCGNILHASTISQSEQLAVERILKKSNSKIHFEENLGQWESDELGRFNTHDLKARFFDNKVSFLVNSMDRQDVFVYNMDFNNLSKESSILFKRKIQGKKKYIGCVEEVPLYSEVWYKNIYPQIDLRFYANEYGQLEFDYIVHPGGDPEFISYELKGVDDLSVQPNGSLVYCSPFGELASGAAYTYQAGLEEVVNIPSRYEIVNDKISFCTAAYDKSKALIIDPTVLEWSTYIGGTGNSATDYSRIFLDGSDVYLCGLDGNLNLNFDYPTTPGAFSVSGSTCIQNIVISKFDTLGNLIFSTYLPGTEGETDYGLFDFDAHSVFFAATLIDGSSFLPGISANAFDQNSNAASQNGEIVLGRLDANGGLVWSTYLGGDDNEILTGLSVSDGIVAISGETYSNDLPLNQASTSALIGNRDQFIAKFNYLGVNIFSSYLGLPDPFTASLSNSVITRDGMVGFVCYLNRTQQINVTQNPAPPLENAPSILIMIFDSNNNVHYSTQYNNKAAKFLDIEFEDNQLCVLTIQKGNTGYTSPAAHQSNSITDEINTHLYCIDVANADLTFATYTGSDEKSDKSKIRIYNNNIYVAGVENGSDQILKNQLFLQKFDPLGTQIYLNRFIASADGIVDFKVTDNACLLYTTAIAKDRTFTPTPDAVQIEPLNQDYLSSYILKTDLNANVLYGTWISGLNSATILDAILDDDKIYVFGHTSTGFPTTSDAFQIQATSTATTGNANNVSRRDEYFLLRINEADCIDDLSSENAITPPVINVCKNGTVPFISGTLVSIDLDSLPHYLINGNLTPAQNNFVIEYQWQINFVGSNIWNNISGATNQSYQPQPLNDDTNFRRIVYLEYADCYYGDTSNISLVDVNEFDAPQLPKDTVYYKCETSTINLDVTAVGGTPPYTYQWSPSTGLSNPNSPTPNSSSVESTIYNVDVTDVNGCLFTEQFTVRVYDADAGDEKIACIGTGVQIGTPHISPGNPDFIYRWTPASGLSNPNIAQPIASPSVITTYTLNITGPDNCKVSDDVVINPLQTIADAGNDPTFCFGNTIQIGEAEDMDYTFVWTPGRYLNDTQISNPTVNPTEIPRPNPYRYILTKIHNQTGCTDIDSTLVYVNRANAGIDYCGPRFIGSSDHSDGMANFTWSVTSGDAGSIAGQENVVRPYVNPTMPTTYFLSVEWNGVVCTDSVFVPGCGCLVPNADAYSDINCPVGDIEYNTIIFGSSIDTSKYDYLWSPTNGIPDPSSPFPQPFTASLTVETSYTLTASLKTNSNISCATSVILYPVPEPFPFAHTKDTITCLGEGINIGGPTISGWTAEWTPDNGTLSNAYLFDPIATPTQTSIYFLTIEETASECQIKDTAVVEIFEIIADAGVDENFCENSIVQLGTEAIPGLTYSWEPSLGLENSNSAQPIDTLYASTTYYLTVSDSANTCTEYDTLVYTVVNNPTANAGEDITVCQGGQGLQIGSPPIIGDEYQWSPTTGLNDPNIAQPIANPSSTTTYTLTVSNNAAGCFSTDAITVTVANGESIDAGPDAIVCINEQIQIGTSPSESGYTFAWSPTIGLNNANIAQPTATVTDTITYTVVMTSPTGCMVQDQVMLSPDSPIVDAGADYSTCVGTELILGTAAIAGHNYSWSPVTGLNNPIIAQPTLTATSDQIYTLTVTVGNNCNAIDQVSIIVEEILLNPGPDETVCSSGVVIGGASLGNGYTYNWSPTNSLNNPNIANPTASPSIQTTYTLVVTDITNSCTVTDEIVVTPSVNSNAGNDHSICLGERIQIGTPAVAGHTYSWSPSANLDNPNIAQPIATVSATTTYTLTVSNGSCESSDAVLIKVNQYPNVEIEDFGAICQNECIQLQATQNSSYRYNWSPTNSLNNPNIPNPIACPTSTTTYSLIVTDIFSGCSITEYTTVNVSSSPAPMVFAGPDRELCPEEITFIGVPNQNQNNTYSWSSTQYLSSPFSSYTEVIIPESNPGEYTYILTATNNTTGCIGRDTVIVVMGTEPNTPLINDEVICSNSNIIICEGCTENTLYSYLWTSDENIIKPDSLTISVNPTTSAIFDLLVTDNENGCTAIESITIEVNEDIAPIADAGEDQAICVNETVGIGQSDNGETYTWYPESLHENLSDPFISNPTFSASETGTYLMWLEVSDTEGCNNRDSIEITVLERTIYNAGSSFFTCESDAILNATIENGTGEWSLYSGPNIPQIESPTMTTSLVSNLIPGSYKFAWKVTSNETCNTGDFDLVSVQVTNRPDVTTSSTCEIINSQSYFSYTISVDGNGLPGTYNINGFDEQFNLNYDQEYGPFGPFLNDNNSQMLSIETDFINCKDVEHLVSPACEEFDFGDLPDTGMGTGPGNYETFRANNGPTHKIITNLKLSLLIDSEPAAQPSVDAQGDGTDEDAFYYLNYLEAIIGADYKIPFSIVNTTGETAYLEVWVDWNGDGDFEESDESLASINDDGYGNFPSSYLELSVPSHVMPNSQVGFRARLSLQNNMTPYGLQPNGEVEDYLFRAIENENICLPISIVIMEDGIN